MVQITCKRKTRQSIITFHQGATNNERVGTVEMHCRLLNHRHLKKLMWNSLLQDKLYSFSSKLDIFSKHKIIFLLIYTCPRKADWQRSTRDMLAPAVFSQGGFYFLVASCVSIHTECIPYFLFPGEISVMKSCCLHKML